MERRLLEVQPRRLNAHDQDRSMGPSLRRPFDQRPTINGRPMLRISAGGLTGYWVWQGNVATDGL